MGYAVKAISMILSYYQKFCTSHLNYTTAINEDQLWMMSSSTSLVVGCRLYTSQPSDSKGLLHALQLCAQVFIFNPNLLEIISPTFYHPLSLITSISPPVDVHRGCLDERVPVHPKHHNEIRPNSNENDTA